MNQEFDGASSREFSRRMATAAEACSDIVITPDRREGAERRKADRWVERAIVAAERRASQRSKAGPPRAAKRSATKTMHSLFKDDGGMQALGGLHPFS